MYHVNAGKLPGNDISRTFEGGSRGQSSVSFFLVHNQPGQGPELHHHPYDETFIVLEGHVLIRVGDETAEAGPGDIAVGPPGIPHGFTNLGPGRARLVCIHAAPAMQTTFVRLQMARAVPRGPAVSHIGRGSSAFSPRPG